MLGGFASVAAAQPLPPVPAPESPWLQLEADHSPAPFGLGPVYGEHLGSTPALQWQLGRGTQLMLRAENDSSSLLCSDGYGLASAVGGLAERCLLDRLDRTLLPGSPGGTRLDAQLLLPNLPGRFDLSFGLSWLQPMSAGTDASDGALDLFDERFQPSRGLIDDFGGLQLSLQGVMHFGQDSWLRISAGRGRYQFNAPELLLPQRWTSHSLGVDAGTGAFSGGVIGRRVESPLLRRSYVDFDVGLSWRTPWSGKVTVGARNLFGNAETTPGTPAPLSREDENEARVPYVRYHQDL